MRNAILAGLESSAVTWTAVLVLYEHALRAAGRSPGTIRLHWHYLNQLRTICGPFQVTTELLREVMGTRDWAPETRKSARTTYRSFYRWAHGAGYIADDPAAALEAVKVPAGRPRPAPEHVVRQLLEHRDPRIGFMAMLAAYGGLRCAEVAQVHARDLVGDELVVHGKGGKVRAVPVVDETLLGRLRAIDDADGWAFPNGLGSHLSPAHVSRLLSRELPEGWTAHTLRHRCASTAYAATRDLLAVGQLLGHSRPETTQRYVLLPDDALRSAARAAALVA